ncbi:MAG: hypothetical protein FWE07_04845 [Turicibacter sp.]|nr:hypothetical protein [Turicibacter sp.]
MKFRTETFVTKALYQGLANPKQLRRNTAFSLMIIAIIPVLTIPSLLDATSPRSAGFDLFGLILGFIGVLILQLPRLTVRRGIMVAEASGILDTWQTVAFSAEGVLKNEVKLIPYRDILAILVMPDMYLLTSKGAEWTFVDKEGLGSEGCRKAFETLLEQNCPQARWTQAA